MDKLVFIANIICNIAFVVSIVTVVSMLFMRYKKLFKRYLDKRN